MPKTNKVKSLTHDSHSALKFVMTKILQKLPGYVGIDK